MDKKKNTAPYLAVPNSFIDLISPKISGNAVKIFYLFLSESQKSGKKSVRISLSKIMKRTGIKHHMTITDAIIELIEHRTIERKQTKSGYKYSILLNN